MSRDPLAPADASLARIADALVRIAATLESQRVEWPLTVHFEATINDPGHLAALDLRRRVTTAMRKEVARG